MNLKRHGLLFVVMGTLSLCIPLAAGSYWLWTQHWLIWWAASTALLALVVWAVQLIFKRYRGEPKWLDVSSNIIPTHLNDKAWKRVEMISLAERDGNPDLGDSAFYLKTLTQVMGSVAEVYYPQHKQAILEVKIPYLLKVIEIFAQELRLSFSENVPGSHVFSVNDFAQGHRIACKGLELYRLFRIVTAGIDPITAMVRELKVFAFTNLLADSTDDLKRWLIDAYIKKIGYYAIELYSGNMTLDDDAFKKPTQRTQHEIDDILQRGNSGSHHESMRLLMVGQNNAGKSSLINALAGRYVANVDAVSTSNPRMSFLLRRDDLAATMVVDSRRYQSNQSESEWSSMIKLATKSDIVILVLSASNAAREIDKIMLRRLNSLPNPPRILVVLSQIDRLRPIREWRPPYDLSCQGSQKAEAIRQAVDTCAQQLDIERQHIIPMCLKQNQIYNCEESLLPLLKQQLQYKQRQDATETIRTDRLQANRLRLWRQIMNAGMLMASWGVSRYARSRLVAMVA